MPVSSHYITIMKLKKSKAVWWKVWYLKIVYIEKTTNECCLFSVCDLLLIKWSGLKKDIRTNIGAVRIKRIITSLINIYLAGKMIQNNKEAFSFTIFLFTFITKTLWP